MIICTFCNEAFSDISSLVGHKDLCQTFGECPNNFGSAQNTNFEEKSLQSRFASKNIKSLLNFNLSFLFLFNFESTFFN